MVWDGLRLILQADNDFDSDGRALIDEFSEAIPACIKDGFDGDIGIASIHASGSCLTRPKTEPATRPPSTLLAITPCASFPHCLSSSETE